MPDRLVLATRGSKLALAQSEWVADQLRRHHPGLRIELLVLKTTGDRLAGASLAQIGGKGLFTKEIEEALIDGRADIAVHSLKDLPTDTPPGLTLAAMPEREDPRDVLICRSVAGLEALPDSALIGTCSPRRIAQLAHHRPDLRFHPLRGNVDSRLRKMEELGLDAIVLAGAGLVRMGLGGRITQWLPVEVSVPAAGQGIIAVEARDGDRETLTLLAAIDCPQSRACARVERAALARLGGGCRRPVGIVARVDSGLCIAEGTVLGPQGDPCYRASVSGTQDAPETLGRLLADRLLRLGAADLLDDSPSV